MVQISELKKLNLVELQELLADLQLYKKFIKQLGQRGIEYYNRVKTGKRLLVVEYFPALEKDFVLQQAQMIYTDVFELENISATDIKLVENNSIQGGMRVFLDDKVLDLTYAKIENQFV